MKVIGSLGRKGGSGKSMISHLLAHGLSKAYGLPVNVVMTDVREDKPVNFNPNREYFISSIGNKDAKQDTLELDRIFAQTAKIPDSILIIDGGANRANIDMAFSRYCDMILIPMGYGVEDIRVGEADFWNLIGAVQEHEATGRVCIIRNRWPGAERERDRILNKPWVKLFMQKAERSSMLFPDFVPEMPSLLDMANADDPKTTPLIDSVSARFAEIVAAAVGIDLPPRRKLIIYPTMEEIRRVQKNTDEKREEAA
jgi:cellulose biosynthesis protein BcsQ